MPVRTIRAFLDEHGVRYVIIQHSPAYTSQEIAESVHIAGRHFAKSVIAKLDGRLALVVVPATQQLDLGALARGTGADQAELAQEEEFIEWFPDCDPGAVPPFGNLFGLPVYLSRDLAEADELVFNAGRYTEVMRIASDDFVRLVQPIPLAL